MSTAAARPPRSATESLLAIALGLEATVVFFVALTTYGLRVLPPAAAFGGGVALILMLVLATRLVRRPWGIWLGWALQVVLIGLGILLPIMFAIGAGFAALWVFCFVKGRQLDAAKLTNPFTENKEPE